MLSDRPGMLVNHMVRLISARPDSLRAGDVDCLNECH